MSTDLSCDIIESNLREAIEQLEKLKHQASTGELNEAELMVGLRHAYHHVNFAWNIRRVPASRYAKLTHEEFERWGKYPAEIDDEYDLARFVDAQDAVYPAVWRELREGRKRTHWMWFVFPQIHGLGRSSMAQKYAISGLDEARAYLAHPVLGGRLRECTRLVNAVEGRTVHEIFGSPDDMKFHSSMTLFAEAGGAEFLEALRNYFSGERDQLTLDQLGC
jgi:uncharacterized protein (DUF1810 family)